MLWQKHKDSSKWEQTDQIIDNWLHERQELLVAFYRINNLQPFENEFSESQQEALQYFCQLLVDYVSAGHFEVFEKIASANEQYDTKHTGLDKVLLTKILHTTMKGLDFSNKYSGPTESTSLKGDLEELANEIAKRMDLEDKLIASYMQATKLLNLSN